MIEERAFCSEKQAENWEIADASQVRTFKTAAGPLLLSNNCPPSLVERLRADDGLRAFARLPEREHQLLLNIARQPDSRLTLAYTFTGEIVGQATLAPANSWWEGLPNTYEGAIEVSPHWRKRGIAHQLLRFAFELEELESLIVLGMGLSWHWDFEGVGLSRFGYRAMIERLFNTYGFAEYLTSEPNISMDPANILMVRIGNAVEQECANQFFQRLLQSDTLPGL